MPRPNLLNQNDREILGVLAEADRPLSAYDILAGLRTTAIRAPNQVYRSLDKLGRQGLVHRIEALNAFIACHHAHAMRPGFVICRTCGAVREIEDERLGAIAGTVARSGFEVETVCLEIYGCCRACQSGPEARP